MAVMLERWNDDKMDALAVKVDGIGGQLREHRKETREDMRELRGEMKDLREEVKDLRKEMGAGFERLGRVIAQGAIALSSAMIVGFATVLATQL